MLTVAGGAVVPLRSICSQTLIKMNVFGHRGSKNAEASNCVIDPAARILPDILTHMPYVLVKRQPPDSVDFFI
jgi:hypothetical protein